jgi:antitoxin component YwqK of YwqJK toxin-antitoxin module
MGKLLTAWKRTYGIGKYVSYFEKGNKESEGLFYNDTIIKLGKWQYWHENGQIASEQLYHESKGGLRVGTWRYWGEEGNLTKEEFYEVGLPAVQ